MTRLERFALWCVDYLLAEKDLIVPSDIDRLAFEQCIFLNPGDARKALRKLGYGGFVEPKWVENRQAPFPEAYYEAYEVTERGMQRLWKIPVNPWEIFTSEEDNR